MSARQARKFCLVLLLAGAAASCKPTPESQTKSMKVEARKALRQQSYDNAIRVARSLIERQPQDDDAWSYLAQAQFAKRDFGGTRETLDRWRHAVLEPSSKLGELEGDLALANGDARRAAAAWHDVLNEDPQNVRVLEKVGFLERSQRHWQEEISAWSALLRLNESASTHANRALARRHLHQWDEALADLHRAQDLAPKEAEVISCARRFEKISKVLVEIRELDSRIASAPTDAELLSDRALLFLRADDADLAIQDTEQAARVAPWAIRPVLFQALALIGINRADDCVKLLVRKTIRLEQLSPEMLETFARLDRDISVERTNAEHFVSRAWSLNEIDQPALAVRDAETAAKLDPQSVGAMNEWGFALAKLGAAEDGYGKVKRATELDPSYAAAWQYRGELEMQGGNIPAAIESFSRALAINQTAASLRKREECYLRIGQRNRADQDHRALQELSARSLK